jgi:hypothetical protein
MDIVGRVKGILLDPKAEWPKIESEPGDAGFLFPNYVMILAAIGPVCGFIGGSVIGYGGIRVGLFGGMIRAIVIYALSLAMVFVMAYIIDFLAGTFNARKDLNNAMRVSSYAPTASWLVGIFNLIPFLGFLAILGLYSVYLLHTGIVALMRPPADKAVIYTIAVIACLIVLWFVVFGILAALFGVGMMMM